MVSQESCFLCGTDKEAPIPSEIPVNTKERGEHFGYEKVPEGFVTLVSFFGYSENEIHCWRSEFTHVLQAVNELHFVVLEKPFVDALPISPPVW